MKRVALALLALSLGLSTGAWAKGKKKAEAIKLPKKPEFKPVGGPLPALPRPTDLSLHFAADASDGTDADAFASEATAPSAATTAAPQHMAWAIAQWRAAIGGDVRKLRSYRRALGVELRKAQKENFPVAIRYLTGVYESADQLVTLSEQSLAAFNSLYTTDRDGETHREPPELARRVRLYLDRVAASYYDAKSFVARTTQARKDEVVRIDSAE
jgi:hypothetical protein